MTNKASDFNPFDRTVVTPLNAVALQSYRIFNISFYAKSKAL
jgi:hypothetical protein